MARVLSFGSDTLDAAPASTARWKKNTVFSVGSMQERLAFESTQTQFLHEGVVPCS